LKDSSLPFTVRSPAEFPEISQGASVGQLAQPFADKIADRLAEAKL
jgi:hypothetical protein